MIQIYTSVHGMNNLNGESYIWAWTSWSLDQDLPYVTHVLLPLSYSHNAICHQLHAIQKFYYWKSCHGLWTEILVLEAGKRYVRQKLWTVPKQNMYFAAKNMFSLLGAAVMCLWYFPHSIKFAQILCQCLYQKWVVRSIHIASQQKKP